MWCWHDECLLEKVGVGGNLGRLGGHPHIEVVAAPCIVATLSIELRIAVVEPRVHAIGLMVIALGLDLARGTHNHRVWRVLLTFGDEGPTGNNGPCADDSTVHDRGIDADQARVADRCAVDSAVMGDRAEVADDCRGGRPDVDHRKVLDVGHAADLDVMHLGSHHDMGPNR